MMKGVNFTFTATNKAAPAMASFQNGLRAVQQQTQAARVVNGGWMKSMDSNRRTIQQIGMQISDFAIQVGGGQSAMLAFTQQAPQMLQFFGAVGAAAAGFISVFGTMQLVMMRSGMAMNQLTAIFGVLENDFKALASVAIWFKNTFIDPINLIVNNLDVLLIALGGFAAYFGTKWVLSMIFASKVVRVFNLALAMSGTIATAQASVFSIMSAHVMVASTSMATYRAAVISAAAASMIFIRGIFTINAVLWALRTVLLIDVIGAMSRMVATAVVAFGTVAAQAYVMVNVLIGQGVMAFVAMSSAAITSAASLSTFSAAAVLTSVRTALVTAAAVALRVAFLTLNVITTAAALAQVGFSIAMGVARAATIAFVFALRAVSAAIIATGIGAMIIAAAWLIERLMTLREKTGSWAEVLKLLGDVAKGVWIGIYESAGAIAPGLASVWELVKAGFFSLMEILTHAWGTFLATIGGSIMGWAPETSRSLMEAATNAMGASIEAADKSTAALNASSAKMAEAASVVTKAWAPAAAALQKIKDILGTDTQVNVADWFVGAKEGADGANGAAKELEKLAKQLEDVKKLFGETMGQFQALGPLGALSISHLNDMWAKFVQDMKTTNNPAGVMDQFKAALGEAAQQAEQLYDTVKSPLEDMFMNIVDGTENVKDAFKKMASSVIKELFRILVVNQMVNSILGFFGIRNPATAVAMSTPSLPSFEGGGSTGYGARAGGLDGKGGFAAVLHPNETVVDHTQGGAAGVAITQNITFGSGVTRAEVQTMIPKIIEATKSAVLDARKRGGKFGGAFA